MAGLPKTTTTKQNQTTGERKELEIKFMRIIENENYPTLRAFFAVNVETPVGTIFLNDCSLSESVDGKLSLGTPGEKYEGRDENGQPKPKYKNYFSIPSAEGREKIIAAAVEEYTRIIEGENDKQAS